MKLFVYLQVPMLFVTVNCLLFLILAHPMVALAAASGSRSVTVESWKRQTARFDMLGDEKISSLKLKVEKKWLIPYEEQRLIVNGELISDNATLDDYPEAGDFIWLANPLIEEMGRVYAKTNSAKDRVLIPMQVGAKDTIGQFIKAIGANSYLPEEKIRLFFQGKELKDKSKTARDYKLFAECWLEIRS